MSRRTFSLLILGALIASGTTATGQESKPGQPTPKASSATTRPAQQTPRPTPRSEKPGAAPEVYPQSPAEPAKPVVLDLARGGRVGVTTRQGRVSITGWDKATLEATARSDQGSEQLVVEATGEGEAQKVSLYVPARARRAPIKELTIEVRVPRYAIIDSVESTTGDVMVANIDASVSVASGSGNVSLNQVQSGRVRARSGAIAGRDVKGDFFARSLSGPVVAERVAGAVDVSSNNGSIQVRNTEGNVRANAAAGDISVHCAKGRVDLSTANGSVVLVGIGGDVDATSASGSVLFTGPIRADGNYRLKSLSGEVEMAIQPDAPGFNATLITYSGDIETDFPIKMDGPFQGVPINRRVSGRYGKGGANVTLDSFSGTVKIGKATAAQLKECR